MVNEELGLFDDAFQYYEDAMRMQMEILDQNDLDIAFSLSPRALYGEIGKVQGKSGDLDDALDSLKEGKLL